MTNHADQSRGPTDAATTSALERRSVPLDGLDDALVALRRVMQRPGYRRRLLEGLGEQVEMGTLRMLRVVQRSEDAPSIGEVAEVLTIGPSTASRVVDRAVAQGHLERRACDDDRRRARLHLTPAGRELLHRVSARRRELLAEVTAEWDDGRLAHLVDSLRLLISGFDALEASA